MLKKVKQLGRKFVHWAQNNQKQFFILSGTAAFLVIVGIPIFTYMYFAKDLGSKETIVTRNDEGVTLLDRKDRPFFTFYEAKKKNYIPLSQMSKSAQQAVIASEDKDFYNEGGVSPKGMARSFMINVLHRGIAQGGSIITTWLVWALS
jgi:membrane peptidoglycan carboxypeptidase